MNTLKHSLLAAACALALQSSASAIGMYGVTGDNDLVTFDSTTPATFNTTVGITGLKQSDGVTNDPFGTIFELSYNPVNSTLYGLDGNSNFYSINSTTGFATILSNSFTPSGFSGGLAYDPFFANFRFVSDDSENVEFSTSGSFTLGNNTFYSPGDANAATAPQFFGLAIDRDFGTGFAIDANLDTLSFSIDPDFEEFFTIGGLGINVTSYGSLEILDDGTLLASLSTDAFSSALYSINTTTGVATKIGDFSTGTGAMTVPEPSTWALIVIAGGLGLFVARRKTVLS